MSEQNETPFLDAFAIHQVAPPLLPGRLDRVWMDEFTDRQPYRCLPLSMANSSGWEITCPFPLDIEWNGGPEAKDIKLSSPQTGAHIEGLAVSHFRRGIVTFHTGYIFKTPPGWAVTCGGPPNWPKDGIYPLSGLIETDWLPFPFTMNWQMTRKGKVRFEKDEPFCFITLSEHRRQEAVQPKIKAMAQDAKLTADYKLWTDSRSDFIARLAANEDSAVSDGWQRHYMKGQTPTGGAIEAEHNTKRRLKKPLDLRGGALLGR
jgi:hypothetical protein